MYHHPATYEDQVMITSTMDPFDNRDSASISRLSMITFELPGSDIQRCGYLKKLKTMKKKYFVLRSTSSSGPARLEYYDSEKKFKQPGHLPKRVIHLHTCFNINKKCDTRQKNAIALYLKDECFSVIAEDADDMQKWLDLLLEYQMEYVDDVHGPYTHYDFIWQVAVKPKGLGTNKQLCGNFRLCLGDTCVSFIRNYSDRVELEIQLKSIRRCGHSDGFFFMEVGRSAPTGEGQLWMQVEDSTIAQNMHEVLLDSMKRPNIERESNFRQRSCTGSSMTNRPRDFESEHQDQIRDRSGSESWTQGSPRRRIPENKRPNTMCGYRPQSFMQDHIFSTSPLSEQNIETLTEYRESDHHLDKKVNVHSYENVPKESGEKTVRNGSQKIHSGTLSGQNKNKKSNSPHTYYNDSSLSPHDRLRSDSAESRTSRSSMAPDVYGSSPVEPVVIQNRSMTPEMKDANSYLSMTPGQRSSSPSPSRDRLERSGSISTGSDREVKKDSYMEMRPGSSVSNNSETGYLDMAPTGSQINDRGSLNSGYLVMGPAIRGAPSAPIPIRSKDPGYMDMTPATQHLPTVKEGGSGEAYLPMTPSGSTTTVNADNLRPAKVISYLSDDSMSGEFPKRSFSVGSRPTSKTVSRHQVQQESQGRHKVSDNGRCSSAPHLIVQKMKVHQSPHYVNTDFSPSCSPMSQSLRSDDSGSFMEMDFYRPRTASDSFGCRPRSSSIGKVLSQAHRPRSSSYGQQSKLAQLAHDVRKKVGSFESVRSAAKELGHKMSQDSISKFSQSSKASSSESLRHMTPNNSEYVEMHLDKRETDGYIDMTIGQPKGGSSSKSTSVASRSSSYQSLSSSPAVSGFISPEVQEMTSPNIKIIKATDQTVQRPMSQFHSTDNRSSGMSLFSPAPSSGSRSPSVAGRSPAGSGRESEEESYVPYAPRTVLSTEPKTNTSSTYYKPDRKKERISMKNLGVTKSSSSAGSYGKESPKQEKMNILHVKTHSSDQDNEYMDYEPGDVEKFTKDEEPSMDKLIPVKHVSPVQDSKGGRLESTNESQKKIRDAPQKNNERKEVKDSDDINKLPRNNSSDLYVDTDNLDSQSIDKNVESPDSEKSQEVDTQKMAYTYMEFDPSAPTPILDENIKSPTRVRSYISSTSMEADYGKSSSDLSPEGQSSLGSPKTSPGTGITQSTHPKQSTDSSDTSLQLGSSNEAKKESEAKKRDRKLDKPKERPKKATEVKGQRKMKVKNVTPIRHVPEIDSSDDDGYVGLDFGDKRCSSHDSDLVPDTDLFNLKSNTVYGEKRKIDDKRIHPKDTPGQRNFTGRVQSDAPHSYKMSPLSSNGQNIMLQVAKNNGQSFGQTVPRKTSVSSLDEMKMDGISMQNKQELDKSNDSLDRKSTLLISHASGSELQKQNSMPCMTLPEDLMENQNPAVPMERVEFANDPRSRHSCSDLSSPYEQMTLPSTDLSSGSKSSSQQQLVPPSGSKLNYVSLDLGSNEDMGNDPKSPRMKSRNSSSADEVSTPTPPPLSYAQIDFEMSESLKASGNKEQVKFSIE